MHEITGDATAIPRAVPGAPLYELAGVERTYAKGGVAVRALRGIDLTIEAGETLALEGPSGSGKTTLLQLLGALDHPSAGTIRLDGRDLSQLPDRELTKVRSDEIGFVFQQFNLIPTLTAEENVAIAMVPAGIGRDERRRRSAELLERVGLGHRLGHLPSSLSGGEQQRVAIARALANHPKVVIADEPTGNLDSETARGVLGLLDELHESFGVTLVIATHDEEVAARASRRLRMRDGAIVEDGAR